MDSRIELINKYTARLRAVRATLKGLYKETAEKEAEVSLLKDIIYDLEHLKQE